MTNREYVFFVFFLPLFALKLLDIVSGNLILTVAAGVSFIFVLGEMLRDRFQVDFAKNIFSLLLFTALLVFTSGKTGVFFSSIFLVALKGINLNEIEGWPEEFIDLENQTERAYELASTRSLCGKNDFQKLVRFLMSRGFAMSDAIPAVKRVLKEAAEKEQ